MTTLNFIVSSHCTAVVVAVFRVHCFKANSQLTDFSSAYCYDELHFTSNFYFLKASQNRPVLYLFAAQLALLSNHIAGIINRAGNDRNDIRVYADTSEIS